MRQFLAQYIPGISRVVSNAAPLLVLFVLSKFLPTEEIGLLSYFIAIITLIGIFTDFGMSEGVQRFLPQNKSPRLIFSTLSIEFVLCIIGALVFLILDTFFQGNISKGYPWLMFLIIIFSASNVVILIFNGLQDNFKTSLYFLLSTLIFLTVTFSLFLTGTTNAVVAFLLGRLISWVLFTIIPIVDLYIRKLIEFKFELPKGYIKFISNNMVVDISYSLFNQWDAILVINILGAFQNGVYKSVAFIASLPYALSVVLQTKLLPEYSLETSKGNKGAVLKSFNKYNKMLLALLIVVVIFSAVFSRLILSVTYTQEISELGYAYLTPILLSVMLYVLAVPSVSVLLALQKEYIVRNMSLIQAFGFIILSSILIQSFGLVILPISLILLNSLFFVVNYYFARRYLR